jgi:hypothetical protein
MSGDKRVLHINPVGENWDIESDAATLGQAETRTEALELAKELAPQEAASTIQVHTADGHVEEEIRVNEPLKP